MAPFSGGSTAEVAPLGETPERYGEEIQKVVIGTYHDIPTSFGVFRVKTPKKLVWLLGANMKDHPTIATVVGKWGMWGCKTDMG